MIENNIWHAYECYASMGAIWVLCFAPLHKKNAGIILLLLISLYKNYYLIIVTI